MFYKIIFIYLKMFTLSQLTLDSMKVARDGENTLFYTDLTRDEAKEDIPHLGDYLQAKEEFTPTAPTSLRQRFVSMLLGPSGCGKSFFVNKMVKNYHASFPDAPIFYISACDLYNDRSYKDTRQFISEIDVFALDGKLDFNDFSSFKNSLVIFDDCDSGFAINKDAYKVVDPDMTKEQYEELPIRKKKMIAKEAADLSKIAETYVNQTLLSLIKNGRKYGISILYISHKPFDGSIQTNMLSECTSVVLYPSSSNRDNLKTFMVKKMSISKKDADKVMEMKQWYKYDFLEIFYRVSKPFIVTSDVIATIKDL